MRLWVKGGGELMDVIPCLRQVFNSQHILLEPQELFIPVCSISCFFWCSFFRLRKCDFDAGHPLEDNLN